MRAFALCCAALVVCSSHTSWAQQAPVEITVSGERRAPSPTELTLSGEKAREGAGTQGDPAKALQSLPGLGRGGIGGGDVVMWGSEPRESRIEVDDVEIPFLYHGSGVRSVLPPSSVATLRSVPGAYGSDDGGALGGLVLLDTKRPDPLAARLQADADLLDAGLLASVPLRAVDGAAQAGFRYGYADRWLPQLMDAELRGLYRVPSYWDARAELDKTLHVGETVRLVALTSSDANQTELLGADPARRQRARDAQSFGRIYLQYQDVTSREQQTQITPFVGWDKSERSLEVGPQSSSVQVSALRYGLRARHRAELGPRAALTFGLDIAGRLARVERRGSLSVPRREGDPYPFGTPPGAGYASDGFRAHVLSVAPFVESELRLTPSLRVTPGLRFEPTLLEASRGRPPLGDLPDVGRSQLQAALEPRLSIEQRLSGAVRLFAAVGRYHQAPDVADLSARFGNPALGLSSATHVVVGESAALASRTRVELSVFGKWLNELPTRNLEPAPERGQALVGTGTGRAFGSQLFLRQADVHGFSGWLSATISRSERQAEDGQKRLSDFDAPLVLAASVVQRLGTFRVGARARFSSGAPRTPVVGAYYDVSAERYQPLLGATNSVRLRDFFQLDLRIDRRFELGGESALELYVDALNVTWRKNAEEWAYSSDFSRIGNVTGLPPLVIVGATLQL